MSFNKTTSQILDRTKTVTRRTGWRNLKPGDELIAVEKARGVKAEERIVLARLRVVSVIRAPLRAIFEREEWADDAAREGFPGLTESGFVELFCKAFKCDDSLNVARIEFEYVSGGVGGD